VRPLQISPRHAITRLALSPDGGQLLVAQGTFGVRLFDAITGAELEHTSGRDSVFQTAPTNRHSLHLQSIDVRFAEVTAGRPFSPLQTGWTRNSGVNRPPTEPGTLPLQMTGRAVGFPFLSQLAADIFNLTWPPSDRLWHMSDCSLSVNHRFAVGRISPARGYSVCDLATEGVAALLTAPDWDRSELSHTRAVFTPDETRVVAVTPSTLLVFDLPPPVELPEPGPEPPLPSLFSRLKAALFLTPPGASQREIAFPALPVQVKPTVAVPVTQSQPDQEIPTFAVLPCGQKIIIRGTKSRVELRDLATGEVLTVWKWGLPRLTALACAADGLTAAAGGTGGRVVLWDLG